MMALTERLQDLIAADALDEAIATAAQRLAAKPTDVATRHALIDLLIVAEDFERADKHAAAAAKLAPQEAVGWGRLRRLLRGMFARKAWTQDGAAPSFPLGPTESDRAAIRLDLALRDGSSAEAAAARDALERARGERETSWNGELRRDLRDLDDRTQHAIEAITDGGGYLWVDLALVRRLSFSPPARLRDFAYRRARLSLVDGSGADVLVPAIYPLEPDAPAALALGRETEWIDGPGGTVTGRGLRCFLAGDEMRTIFEARDIEPAAARTAAHG